jgi:predicted nucleic acid-binding protein
MGILLDTNILVHALNSSSPYQEEAAQVLREAMDGKSQAQAHVSPQIIYELYAVITDSRRVENPLTPVEAGEICLDIWESRELGKINSSPMAPRGVLNQAKELELKGGDIFDCVLAITANENGIETIYTENIKDFDSYSFLRAINPLRGETQDNQQ